MPERSEDAGPVSGPVPAGLSPLGFGEALGEYARANSDEAIAYEQGDLLGKHDAQRRLEEARAAVLAAYFAMQDRAINAERERDLLAETAKRVTAERDALAGFARKVIESSSFRGCDLDGGDVQDWAVEAGILVPVTMTARCMENPEECACAEFGFPTTCYRFAARAATAPARTGEAGRA